MDMQTTVTAETIESFFKETRELFRETALHMQETDRRMQETDRRMQETDRRMKETEAQMKDTDRKIKEVSILVGNLGNRLGEFVEEMVVPAVLRLFRDRGIEVHQVFRNAKGDRDGDKVEVDIIVINGDELVAVECKSKLSREDVEEHIVRLGKLRRMFPPWAQHRIYGAVATMVVDERATRYAEQKGMFVIAQSGETVEIRNQPNFRPSEF